MAVVVIDGCTVRQFVNDNAAFNNAVDIRFRELDANRDGVLSPAELRACLQDIRLLESHLGMPVKKTPHELNALYDTVFRKFDLDGDGKIDVDEFRVQMKDILLAVADGLGCTPLYMLMEEGSILQDAVHHEDVHASIISSHSPLISLH